jgi:hypothetical protein
LPLSSSVTIVVHFKNYILILLLITKGFWGFGVLGFWV